MVVHYASGGEGSWTSMFTVLPRILIKMEGSVLPHITPQLLLVAGLGALSIFWNPLRGQDGDDESLKLQPAMSVRAHREHGLPAQCSCFAKPVLILEVPQPARSELTHVVCHRSSGFCCPFSWCSRHRMPLGNFGRHLGTLWTCCP